MSIRVTVLLSLLLPGTPPDYYQCPTREFNLLHEVITLVPKDLCKFSQHRCTALMYCMDENYIFWYYSYVILFLFCFLLFLYFHSLSIPTHSRISTHHLASKDLDVGCHFLFFLNWCQYCQCVTLISLFLQIWNSLLIPLRRGAKLVK